MLTAMAMMLLLAACPTALHSKDYDPLCYCDGKPIMLADPCVYKGGDTYYLTVTIATGAFPAGAENGLDSPSCFKTSRFSTT